MQPQSTRDKAERLFAACVRARGQCEAEGHRFPCSGRLECAHWLSRRYAWTATDPHNAYCLCNRHHRWFGDHPVEWAAWTMNGDRGHHYPDVFARSLNRSRYDWLTELARQSATVTTTLAVTANISRVSRR